MEEKEVNGIQQSVKIQPFVLVQNRKVISEWLIPTSEIGRVARHWFDEATVIQEFTKKESKDGVGTRVSHPCSKIGQYFKKNRYTAKKYQSAFFMQNSIVVYRLKDLQLIDSKDIKRIKRRGSQVVELLLRCYTPEQVEVYVQSEIDRSFTMKDRMLPPIEIDISEADKKTMYVQYSEGNRNKLF